MNLPRPTEQEERWLSVANRYPALHDAAEARAGGWKTPSLLSRVLMFALGLLSASLVSGSLFWAPGHWFVTGLAMVVAAEWLIRKRRLFAGGIEEALIACGLLAIVAQLVDSFGNSGDVVWLVMLSLAVLAAGLRVGNALFTTLAAIGLSFAVAAADDGFTSGDEGLRIAAMCFCIAIALAALVLGDWRWMRPSHERMLDALVIAMPAAASGWAMAQWSTPPRLATLGSAPGALIPPLLALAFAITLAVVGVRRRSHAPLIGALVLFAFLAYELREFTGLSLHARMIVWGSLLLALGFALDRGLRRPRGGITSAPLGPRSRVDDLVQIYGAAQVMPAPLAPAAAAVEGQGGSFGGGGASGRF